jgi:UDP-GlcNAc3NAcA epimerase
MPEEINRVLTDHIADILFAPSQTAVSNLQAESIPSKRIFLTGDVMYDASLYYYNLAREKSCILDTLNTDKYILATIHRAENTDNFNRMEEIFNGLIKMTENIPVILPLHPRTRESLKKYKLLDRVLNSIKVIPPVGYLDMAMLEKNATLIVTDSGGVQKESYFYEVPCLTVRDETEWIELVEAGWNRLVVPLTSDNLINHINEIQNSFRRPGSIAGYLGDGQAANIIMDLLLKFTNI